MGTQRTEKGPLSAVDQGALRTGVYREGFMLLEEGGRDEDTKDGEDLELD